MVRLVVQAHLRHLPLPLVVDPAEEINLQVVLADPVVAEVLVLIQQFLAVLGRVVKAMQVVVIMDILGHHMPLVGVGVQGQLVQLSQQQESLRQVVLVHQLVFLDQQHTMQVVVVAGYIKVVEPLVAVALVVGGPVGHIQAMAMLEQQIQVAVGEAVAMETVAVTLPVMAVVGLLLLPMLTRFNVVLVELSLAMFRVGLHTGYILSLVQVHIQHNQL
jgi:hypothetical protein